MSDERSKIIQATLTKIKKDGGLEFRRLGDRVGQSIPHIPTGIWRLDHELIGIGGIPKGRILELIGPEASGKTSIMLHLAASAQKLRETVAFIDAEHALSITYASQLGVKTDDLLVAQPDHGEQALQAAIDLVETKSVGLVIIDSVANLVPKAELEGEMSDAQVGLQARMMAKALRKITGAANKSGTIIAFTNQIRSQIGVSFGNPETTPGGRALRFYASLRLDVRRLAQVKEGDINAGNKTRIKCVKNKVDNPFREANFELFFGEGVDSVGSLVDCAIDYDVWKQKASQYMLQSTGEVITGRKNLRDELAANKELYKLTEEATLRALGKDQNYIDSVVGK